MEIKIVQLQKEENDGFKTFIFEGRDICHKVLYYKNRSEFTDLYNRESGNGGIYQIGIPNTFWDKSDKEIASGDVLIFKFINDKSIDCVIFCKDCNVFITNNGKTIDSVTIH